MLAALNAFVWCARANPASRLRLCACALQWGNRLSYSFRITAMFFLEGACMLLMAGFAPVSYYITLRTCQHCRDSRERRMRV